MIFILCLTFPYYYSKIVIIKKKKLEKGMIHTQKFH